MQRLVFAILSVFCLAASSSYPAIAGTVILNPQDRPDLPSNPDGAMASARERVAAGDLPGAVRQLATYVAGHPGEIGPERLLGDLYYRQGDLPRAEATYKHIIAHAPGDKETHNRLGSVYATEDRLDDAIAEFNRSLPGTDSVPNLVELHRRKGDFGEYEAERADAAREYPADPEAQLELGQVYEAIHQPNLALVYFKRALDNDPYNLFALNGMGLAYLDMKNYDDATRSFAVCLGRDPQNYSCADNLAATYLEDKRYDDARTMLALARRLEPERAEAIVNLGYLADVEGDWHRAVSYYVQAMTVYPYSPDAYINLGVAYHEHGLYQLAQQAVVKGLAVAPEDGKLHYLLGEIYVSQGNTPRAEAQFRIAATSDDPLVQSWAQAKVATMTHVNPQP